MEKIKSVPGLYDVEATPAFGSIPDRLRGDGQIYEFGAAGDHYTMKAPSDKVAIMALIMINGGVNNCVFFYPQSTLNPPMAFDSRQEQYVEQLYGKYVAGLGESIGRFMAINYDAVVAALNSVVIGERLARESYDESMAAMVAVSVSTDALQEYRERWCEKRRTSMYNLAAVAWEAAKGLENLRDDNQAEHQEFINEFKSQPNGSH